MGDEQDLLERKQRLLNDRREQAKWLESLNLLAEALRIYTSINDTVNIERIRRSMAQNYGSNALKLEKEGRYQDAANLYYLAGDNEGVRRMRERKPDLVILYDTNEGGLAKIAKGLDDLSKAEDKDAFFSKPNVGQERSESPQEGPTGTLRSEQEPAQRLVPLKIPKQKRPLSFCPYCGERISTSKEPRFCPYCGEELR